MESDLLEDVRRRAGLSQEELAARAGTSRPTLSAYERGRKSPTLITVTRVLESAGFELMAEPKVTFREYPVSRGRPFVVADRLWRLAVEEAVAHVTLPIGVNWSRPGASFDLRDRRQRARCYEVVLREGTAVDLRRFVDGAFLVDLWDDLVLPRELRAAWEPAIEAVST